MSNSKLNIPTNIKVGFQKRDDTYTKKLAYVIYTDAKGVLRKEKSWQGWRDKKIPAQDFDNVPTSGFVLNKKVGDYKSDWNHRRAAIRIYDPRDFEFEITVENLLFILEETSAIKGKGLEGEFVYAWDGADHVLLPVGSQDYKASAEFTSLQLKKVSAKEMVEGCLYQTKDNHKVMYLGRQDWYQFTNKYTSGGRESYFKKSRQHVFVTVDGKSRYWTQSGFSKIGLKLGDEPSPLYAEEFEKFKNSVNGAPAVEVVAKPFKVRKKKTYYDPDPFILKDDGYYAVSLSHDWQDKNKFRLSKESQPVEIINGEDGSRVKFYSNRNYGDGKVLDRSDLNALGLVRLVFNTKNGHTLDVNTNEYILERTNSLDYVDNSEDDDE